MLTIQALNELGANTQDGLTRCMNMEDFYLKMVRKGLADDKNDVGKLVDAVAANDIEAIYPPAHNLKGVMANLSLTPILEPVAVISDKSKVGTQMDYKPYLDEMLKQLEAFRALL